VNAGTAYLLDTNVLSETRKKKADPGVMAFLQAADSSALYLSVLTIGELRKGIAIKRRTDLSAARALAGWLEGLEFGFVDRILPIDGPTARLWAIGPATARGRSSIRFSQPPPPNTRSHSSRATRATLLGFR